MPKQERRRCVIAGLCIALALAETFALLRPPAHSTSPHPSTSSSLRPAGNTENLDRTPSALVASPLPAGRATRANGSDIEATLTRLEQRARHELESDPRYAEYERCVAKSGGPARECRSILSNALFSAMSRVHHDVAEEATRLAASFGTDSEVLRGYLHTAIAGTRDSVRTVLALTLLERTCPEHGFPLPRNAYADLAQRTDPEAQKILDHHLATALPDASVKDDVSRLAIDAAVDPRVRLSATRALGHDVDAAYLGRIVDSLLGGEPAATPLGIEALPRALGGCGVTCASMIEQLAASPSVEIRRVAYRTLSVTDASAAEALRKQFALISPDASNPERLQAELDAAQTPFGRPEYPHPI